LNFKKTGVFLHDILATGLTWYVSFLLRFNFSIPPENMSTLFSSMVFVFVIHAIVFRGYGLYRSLWRFASLPDLRRIVMSVGVASLFVAMTLFLYRRLDQVPRSVLVLHPILLIGVMGGSRFLYRYWKDGRVFSFHTVAQTPVLLLGAGHAASLLLRDMSRVGEWHVVGILDDDLSKKGRLLSGVPVLGPISDLPHFAKQKEVSHVIIAMPSASPERKRRVVEVATSTGLGVFTVPSLDDILSGRVAVSRVQRVELADLLGRGQVQLDNAGVQEFLSGKIVLVTGAGGSIGAELCRQIARFSPARIVLLDASEFALYKIQQEFEERYPSVPVVSLTRDVRDALSIQEVFRCYTPHVVFHAAAYKHVPLMENFNCWEALKNNVFGTLVVAETSLNFGVEKFVMISSDKAVNPVNVMGATKRLAEMVCQSLSKRNATKFVTVRFGNVLGSTGSVIPKFREQIAQGGPVTVTHPDITRFFMLIPEAAQLVLQAGLMGRGGEIFVLDMGNPIKIVDLARDMIRLSGFTDNEIKIVYTGLRPGEKLYEELLADQEKTLPTPHPKLRVAQARDVPEGWLAQLKEWAKTEGFQKDAEVKRRLREWISDYSFGSN